LVSNKSDRVTKHRSLHKTIKVVKTNLSTYFIK